MKTIHVTFIQLLPSGHGVYNALIDTEELGELKGTITTMPLVDSFKDDETRFEAAFTISESVLDDNNVEFDNIVVHESYKS